MKISANFRNQNVTAPLKRIHDVKAANKIASDFRNQNVTAPLKRHKDIKSTQEYLISVTKMLRPHWSMKSEMGWTGVTTWFP